MRQGYFGQRRTDLLFRQPDSGDGKDVWQLVNDCEPLDENSLYCNLIQCDHFDETCVVAERSSDGKLVGWISAYILPNDPETLFVWQVAVDPSAQGQGVAKRMLTHLLQREACSDVRVLQTTITADNEASWALFKSIARAHGGDVSHEPHFRRDTHFDGEHATEHMLTIRFREQISAAA